MSDLQAYPSVSSGPPVRQTSIWIGPNGLRAGWSLLIYAIIIVALGASLTFASRAIHNYHHPEDKHLTMAQLQAKSKVAAQSMSPKKGVTQEGLLFLVVLLATWIMSRIEKRPFGQYGLGGNQRRWPQFAQGFVFGFAILSLLILMLRLGHYIVFDGELLHGGSILKYAAAWIIVFMCVGLFEEFFFRGYIQYTLARGIGRGAIGFWIAALLWNFAFGFSHGSNPGESPIGVFLAGFVGLMFCVSLWYTRSLWWAIGAHCTWDWGESYFYGTSDSGLVTNNHLMATHPHGGLLMSGGATGPEGSVFAILACILIGVVAWLTLRKEHNKSTNQALVNPLVDPLVPAQTQPVA
jgi:membrane protease YdiL (CAAX protease family)